METPKVSLTGETPRLAPDGRSAGLKACKPNGVESFSLYQSPSQYPLIEPLWSLMVGT